MIFKATKNSVKQSMLRRDNEIKKLEESNQAYKESLKIKQEWVNFFSQENTAFKERLRRYEAKVAEQDRELKRLKGENRELIKINI